MTGPIPNSGRVKGAGRVEAFVKDDMKLLGLQSEWAIFRDAWTPDRIDMKLMSNSLVWKERIKIIFKTK